MHAEDERVGRLLRQIRRRTGQTQTELAVAAAVPRLTVQLIEAGHAAAVPLGSRSVFDAVGGRARLVPWWNGGVADRLLDERHASIVERIVALLILRGWKAQVGVSFANFGERGSIAVLATKNEAAAVCEVKSLFGSLEETNRQLDVKERLAPEIAYKRFGRRPTIIGRLLIVPRDSSIRRVIVSHAATMTTLYPARSREVRAWLREPSRAIRGIWFVSDAQHTSTVHR